ncbi:hypothetical protein [Azorhizophilus paspali]|uniref:Uncharacterized protein n=1 Tax=Azorhizophilus paspali TaxID=69963 RepID=A0ABV6SJP2_AZOPA
MDNAAGLPTTVDGFGHPPYKGSAPALSDVIAGHVDLLSDPQANAR